MSTTRKEHIVLEFNVGERTTWKSVPGSAVAFYASAAAGLQGSAELHAAAAEAFELTGHDRVWVVTDGGERDVVTVNTPHNLRAWVAERAARAA